MKARLVGTFAPIPETVGFEIPLFRRSNSDMTLIQVVDASDCVSHLVQYEPSPFSNIYGSDVEVSEGIFAVYAFRPYPLGKPLVGSREFLRDALLPLVDAGELDDRPIIRFRLTSFLRADRAASDAQQAWLWLNTNASSWAADTWKLESTIVPELRKHIEARLHNTGETPDTIAMVSRLIEAEYTPNHQARVSISFPANVDWAKRCCEKLDEEAALFGDALLWWPELTASSLSVKILEGENRANSREPPVICISGAIEDIEWSQWVKATLQAAGYQIKDAPSELDEIQTNRMEAYKILVLLSGHVAWHNFEVFDPAKLIAVRLEDNSLPLSLRQRRHIDLFSVNEAEAELRLIEAVGGPAPGCKFSPPTDRVRFPGQQTVHNLPPRDGTFIGRGNQLLRMSQWAAEYIDKELTILNLAGMPGIGKTSLSIEFAYQNITSFDVIWTFSPNDIVDSMTDLGQKLRLNGLVKDDPVDADHWLSEHGNCLIIFDGFDRLPDLACARKGRNNVIITSYMPLGVGDGHPNLSISLSQLPEEAAWELIQRVGGTSLKRYEFDDLYEVIGGHPQAMRVASAVIARKGDPIYLWQNDLLEEKEFKYINAGIESFFNQLGGENIAAIAMLCCVSSKINGQLLDSIGFTSMYNVNIAKNSGIASNSNHIIQLIRTYILYHKPDFLSVVLYSMLEHLDRQYEFDELDVSTWREFFKINTIASELSLMILKQKNDARIPFSFVIKLIDALLAAGRYKIAGRVAGYCVDAAASRQSPTEPAARFSRAKTQFARGAYAASFRSFRAVAEFSPAHDGANVWTWAADALLATQKTNVNFFLKEIKRMEKTGLPDLRPPDRSPSAQIFAEILSARLVLALSKGETRAIGGDPTFTEILALKNPNSARAMHALGLYRYECGDLRDADRILMAASKKVGDIWGYKHPYYAEVLVDRMDVLMKLNGKLTDNDGYWQAQLITSRMLGNSHPLSKRLMSLSEYIVSAIRD